jgi:CSLREA domain-containing protein
MKKDLVIRAGIAVVVLAGSMVAAPTASATTITVNTTADVLVNNDGRCSLREAVFSAATNSASGAVSGECAAGSGVGTDVIKLKKKKTYELTRTGADEDINVSGDLDIGSDVEIRGVRRTKIRQTVAQQRVIDILSSTAVISRVTITGGHAPNGLPIPVEVDGRPGGGIRNAGTLTLRRVVVTGNRSGDGAPDIVGVAGGGGRGGGIVNTGTLTLDRSRVTGNATGSGGLASGAGIPAGQGGLGGGVATLGVGSVATIVASIISGNSTGDGGFAAGGTPPGPSGGGGHGGGLSNESGTATITRSVIAGNATGDGGTGGTGGVVTAGGPGGLSGVGGGIMSNGTTDVTGTTISGNRTGSGGTGGLGGAGADGGQGGNSGNGAGIYTSIAPFELAASTVSGNVMGTPGRGRSRVGPRSDGWNRQPWEWRRDVRRQRHRSRAQQHDQREHDGSARWRDLERSIHHAEQRHRHTELGIRWRRHPPRVEHLQRRQLDRGE